MTLFEYMEDYDNWELPTEERKEQLMESVLDYNEENDTDHDPEASFYRYEQNRQKQDE